MTKLNKINILHSLGKLYLSIFALHTMNGVIALPAETKSNSKSNSSDSKTTSSKTDNKTTETKTEDNNKTSTETTPAGEELDLGSGQVCQPNTNSCGVGESCIRFDTDKNDKYTCHKTELAFCESNEYCKTNLGDKYQYCYLPPWATGPNQKRQCFTKHGIGFGCINDIHCENNLACVENVCVSSSLKGNTTGLDFNEGASSSSRDDGTILGINKWVFISVVSFPVIVIILCLWCWIIGRSSSKSIENKKKEKYENELKELTIPTNKDDDDNKHNSKIQNVPAKYINPQKEIEEEVGKRGFRSLFRKKKNAEEKEAEAEPTTVDISSSKVGGKAPINTSATTDTQKKMKKNLTLVNIADKNANTKKVATKKSPSTPAGSKTSSVASFRQDAASTTSSAANTPNKNAAKTRVAKKKTGAAGAKKAKKGPSSSGNDTNTNNSTSSKQSSQRGLVNNASAMSSALSGQSASYFSNVSSLDAQSAIYYQQMYNAAAAQAAVQNQYYASYMQNPYYAAAAQQNAAYYAAAAAQDPNNAALYGNYAQSGYH